MGRVHDFTAANNWISSMDIYSMPSFLTMNRVWKLMFHHKPTNWNMSKDLHSSVLSSYEYRSQLEFHLWVSEGNQMVSIRTCKKGGANGIFHNFDIRFKKMSTFYNMKDTYLLDLDWSNWGRVATEVYKCNRINLHSCLISVISTNQSQKNDFPML